MNAHPSSLSDRELLQLAAKAAGYTLDGAAHSWCSGVRKTDMLLLNDRGGHSVWNPLHDDGDALRLAVKLGAFESFDFHLVLAQAQSEADPFAATRRAIVMYAADHAK